MMNNDKKEKKTSKLNVAVLRETSKYNHIYNININIYTYIHTQVSINLKYGVSCFMHYLSVLSQLES